MRVLSSPALRTLKNADFLTGFTDEFTSVAAYERIGRATLQRRLLLALFALGTNMGIRAIVATGEHDETEAALRHVRRHFITVDNLRAAVTRLVNGTFAARDAAWWGQGTACASDSKKFGSWSSNFMTEYHARYGGNGGNGVMIYWHVEKKNVCIYSQLKSCSSSEVAAMIEGLLRHCTDAEIEANYVDTHGASVVGFAFTELLNFRPLPRLKNIGSIRLYRPDPADPLGADRAAVRPDGQVRDRAPPGDGGGGAGAAALHPRWTQAPHLRRPRRTRPRSSYSLRLRLPGQPRPAPRDPRRAPGRGELEQREHRAALRQGRRPDRPGQGARRDIDARPAPLQSSLVHVNTLLLQQVLAEPKWANRLSVEDRRGLTALFWSNINPYGTFRLDMDRRLDLALTAELPRPRTPVHPAPTVAEAR
ncbi:transposase [Streptomyces sp. NBC_01707]|nr:transposase [Streptomyces sp. NBC_01230]